jgi:shikimate kinase
VTDHWVLIGLMGSGKSAIGRVLAARTGRRFVDNDEALEAVNDGRTARQLQEEVGADRLHELEVDALAAALDGDEPAVIGAAAAVVTVEEGLRQLARAAAVVWLRVPVEVLADRVSIDEETHRPLGDDPLQTLTTQLAERAPAYEAVATLVVEEVADAADLADQILAALS